MRYIGEMKCHQLLRGFLHTAARSVRPGPSFDGPLKTVFRWIIFTDKKSAPSEYSRRDETANVDRCSSTNKFPVDGRNRKQKYFVSYAPLSHKSGKICK